MHRKYERIFVDLLQIFARSEWKEFENYCEITHEINTEDNCVEFTFHFPKHPGVSVIRNLFLARRKGIRIFFRSTGFHFNEVHLRELFDACIGKELTLRFNFDPPRITFHANDVEEVEIFNIFFVRIKALALFIFREFTPKVELDKGFVPVSYRLDSSSRTRHSGERMYLFALDQKASGKYFFGLTDWKDFFWLTEGNGFKEENEGFEKFLEIGKYYRCEYQVGTRNEASFIDGFLSHIRPDENPDETTVSDESPTPILPLCIHTKKSAFDGLYTSGEFVEEVAKRGHKYIAVTDMSSVQDFANLEKHAKLHGIKAIYGTELEMIDDDYPVVVNDTKSWSGGTICVFDIETTGFNALVDEIIEVHIDKFEYGLKIDQFSRLIKIKAPLKKHIVEITGITDEELKKKGGNPAEVLREAREFIRGSLLVAHNGIAFDLPFLNAKLRDLDLDPIDEPLLDSMRFSQSLFAAEKYKSHSLEAVCKKAGVNYETDRAHRAEYDVELLWRVFEGYLLKGLRERLGMELDSSTLPILNETLFKREVFSCVYGTNVLLYAKNQRGIRDMYEIISRAHDDLYYSKPTINPSLLNQYRENLIVVCPPLFTDLHELVLQNNPEEFSRRIAIYDYIMLPPPSHFVHEVARMNLTEEEVKKFLSLFYKWCKDHSKPIILNRCIRYIYPRDHERYLVLINSKGISGKRHALHRVKGNSLFPPFHYASTEEILSEYEFLGSTKRLLKESWKNQTSLLDSIEDGIEPVKKTLHAPSIKGCETMIKEECLGRIRSIYGENPNPFIMDKYGEEIKCIVDNNYSVIYWVSHLLVKESIRNGYLVGSRGSVGSSFVAFLLNISEVNPLPPHYFCRDCSIFELVPNFWESGFDLEPRDCEKCGKKMGSDGHNIPFETFMGFGGNKIPDIDLNFSGKYQNSAHNFLRSFFGETRVYRAGTISATAEKTAFGLVRTYIDELNEAESSAGMPKTKFTHGKFKWLGIQIIDLKRTTGQHPGGILVVPETHTIYDFTPVNYPANDLKSDWLTTHFEFEHLHDSLLKFDILGHDDPTTLALLREMTGLDPMDIPHSDPKVLALFRSFEGLGIKSGDLVNDDNTGAIGLPEFGTLLTRKILEACQPKSFADLIRISGFSHGTGVWKKNIDGLVKGGHRLNEVITCRDDIMIYLMSTGLNREDSFHITEGIRKGNGISPENIELLKKHNVPDWYIESAKKIAYIFPKAHATAYVLMSWKIAYYKLYYPLAFYAVYFTTSHQMFDWDLLRTNDFEKIRKNYREIQRRVKSSNWKEKNAVTNKEKQSLTVCEVALEFLKRGFKFQDIDVNRSSFDRFIIDEKNSSIIIPFIVVDGLGEVKARTIEEERIKNGDYISFSDLIERTSINKKIVETFRTKKIVPED